MILISLFCCCKEVFTNMNMGKIQSSIITREDFYSHLNMEYIIAQITCMLNIFVEVCM